MTGYDIDGTIHKLDIEPDAVVISGRTIAEYDELAKGLALKMPVYIRGSGKYGDREDAARFKAMMIKHLGVTKYYEDDPLQIEIIKATCPDVNIIDVSKVTAAPTRVKEEE